MADENYGGVRRDSDRREGRRGQRGGYEDPAYRQGARDRDYYGGGVEPRFGPEANRGDSFRREDELERNWRWGRDRGEGYGSDERETAAGWPRGGGAYGGSDRGAEEYGRRGNWGQDRDDGGRGEGRGFGRGGGMSGRGRDAEFGPGSGWGGGYGTRDRDRESDRGELVAGGGGHRGKGPRGYQRSDERIREDVSDRLSDDDAIDASDIEVRVENGEVTLTGEVDSKQAKRRAEDLVDAISGVRHVQNNLRVHGGSASRETSRPAGPGVPS